MNEEEKEGLWKKARVESKQLQQKHRQQDLRAITESLKLKECNVEVLNPVCDNLAQGQMIAVACHDAWYPAEVKEESRGEDDVLVSFEELGKSLCSFRWPTGKDVHRVPRTSVESQLDVEIHAGGRYWIVVNAKNVQEKFKKFK